jgi:hypothetical protein
MSRRQLHQSRLHLCRAIGCAEIMVEPALFCERHDRMLQSDIRNLLGKYYRPRRKPSKLFELYFERALSEILDAQQNGHRMPRPADFDFGDDATQAPAASVDSPREEPTR